MSRLCSVKCCEFNNLGSVRKTKISLFKLPTDPELSKKWLEAASGKLRKGRSNQKNFYFCEKHFHERDIIRHFLININNITQIIPRDCIKLQPEACPTIFDVQCERQIQTSLNVKSEVFESNDTSNFVPDTNITEQMYIIDHVKKDLDTNCELHNCRYFHVPGGIMIFLLEEDQKDEIITSKSLFVKNDMSFEVQINGRKVVINPEQHISSLRDLLDALEKLKQLLLCKNKVRKDFCLGYKLPSGRSQFCKPCSLDRRKKLSCINKNNSRAIKKIIKSKNQTATSKLSNNNMQNTNEQMD